MPVSGGNKINLTSGANVACEITNDRDLAKLAVVKKVASGTATEAQFKLSAKGTPSDRDITNRDGNVTTLADVYAGIDYTLSENGPANYSQTGNWVCKTAAGADYPVTGGNTVTLTKNAQVTCTVTNDRDLAKLAVVKKVASGTATEAQFKLSAKGTRPTGTSPTGTVTSPPWPMCTPGSTTPCPSTARPTTARPATGSARPPPARTTRSPAGTPST